MATENKFSWKRPSRAFVLVVVITVGGLLISFALPGLLLPRFSNKPTIILFQVRVIDDQGIPIPNANVSVGDASGQTDLDGCCDLAREYPGKGVKGLTGTCRLQGEMRVEAPGFIAWRGSLTDLFGRNYDYVDKGTNLPHEITLLR
jgi:hypothetical protein